MLIIQILKFSDSWNKRAVKQHTCLKRLEPVKNAMQLGIVGLLLKGTVTRNLSKSKQSKLTPNWVKLTKVKKIIKTDWNCGFRNLLNESRNINKGQYFKSFFSKYVRGHLNKKTLWAGDHSDTLNREDHMYVIHKFQISSRTQNSLTIYNDLSEH